MVTSIPGNHDIGLGDGITMANLDRFKLHFTEGETCQVIELCNFQLVLLDTSSMLNTQTPGVHQPPFDFIDKLPPLRQSAQRVLFTHIPLWRPADDNCGNLRESSRPIQEGRGYQYQNTLSQSLSAYILENLWPVSAVFSGDDHDYCLVHHHVDGQRQSVPEYTVKSFSWAMV
jgi:hypothetical protein